MSSSGRTAPKSPCCNLDDLKAHQLPAGGVCRPRNLALGIIRHGLPRPVASIRNLPAGLEKAQAQISASGATCISGSLVDKMEVGFRVVSGQWNCMHRMIATGRNLPVSSRSREWPLSALPRRWLIRPEGPESTLLRRSGRPTRRAALGLSRDVAPLAAKGDLPDPHVADSASARSRLPWKRAARMPSNHVRDARDGRRDGRAFRSDLRRARPGSRKKPTPGNPVICHNAKRRRSRQKRGAALTNQREGARHWLNQ